MSDLEPLIFSGALTAFLLTGAAKLTLEQIISLVILVKKLKATIKCNYSLELGNLETRVSGKPEKHSSAVSREKLEPVGSRVRSRRVLPRPSNEEVALVEIKLTLGQRLKERRINQGLSQRELAKRLRSRQSRVAQMEAGDPTVSIDLLLRALFAAGAKKKDIAEAIFHRSELGTKSLCRE